MWTATQTLRLRRPRNLGLTLIEIVFVILMIGLIFSFVLPKLNNLTPRYRLRTYARKIAHNIQEMRVIAIARGQSTGLRYDLGAEPQFFQPLSPAPQDYPEQPLSERESILKEETPKGVRIRGVLLPGSRSEISAGRLEIGFAPDGTTGSHIVILEAYDDPNGTPMVLAMKFNSISGIVDYYNHPVEFQHFES